MDLGAIQDFEIRVLLDVLYQRYGYDFRDYADASMKRRILRCLDVYKLRYISEIVPRLLHEEFFLEKLVHELAVGVTTMFRDPSIYPVLRQHIIPELMTHPFINIWHAGCSTGEEVYSMAIFLQEEGLYDRARIYATDLDSLAVQTTSKGFYPANRLEEYQINYRQAGGRRRFADYYRIRHGGVQMNVELRKNMVFSTHNLATDSVFADMNMIFCRNVLIYFATPLQNRVFNLFQESLVRGGVLCLGRQESVQFSDVEKQFEMVVADEKIYRKRFVPRAKHRVRGQAVSWDK